MDTDYQSLYNKYLKYKKKYLNIKNSQKGGTISDSNLKLINAYVNRLLSGTDKQIKDNYKKIVLQFHPDKVHIFDKKNFAEFGPLIYNPENKDEISEIYNYIFRTAHEIRQKSLDGSQASIDSDPISRKFSEDMTEEGKRWKSKPANTYDEYVKDWDKNQQEEIKKRPVDLSRTKGVFVDIYYGHAWLCPLCGAIVNYHNYPDECPVCGAIREDFTPAITSSSNHELVPKNPIKNIPETQYTDNHFKTFILYNGVEDEHGTVITGKMFITLTKTAKGRELLKKIYLENEDWFEDDKLEFPDYYE